MTDPQFPEPQPRPRRRIPRAVVNVAWLLAGMAVAVLVVVDPFDLHPVDDWLRGGLNRPAATAEGTTAAGDGQLWTCGMHPQVLEDHPGPCPICGMNLVPVLTDGGAAGPATAGERRVLFYRNPMDPTVTSPVPAKDSMGMDYVAVYADEAAGAGPVVTIDPTVVQNMNVEVESIERRDITREIRTVGFLDFDQGKMVTVTTKVRGWVEKVYVNYIGEPVRRGQPLFEIYSPELVQTQQELISALGFARRMANAPPEARQRAEALVAAAETRLGLWDISPAQVERLKAGDEPRRTLTVTSPASGVVMLRKPGLEGMAVEPGAELFHLADLSSLWLSVEVFEDQLPWMSPGMTAQISLSYFPGETFTGRVRYVEPQVAETSRTVGLRLEVPNRDGRLRSGMYATVTFAPVAVKNAVAVPSLAVLRTGERNVVIAALGEGRFAPREVVLGAAGDRYVEVVSGLAAGEQVVTSSQFLLDSESNLREAIQKLVAGRREKGALIGSPPPPPPPSTPVTEGAAMLNKIIEWSLRNQFLMVVALAFAIFGGVWAIRGTRLDAIPDLSDVQVIVYTEFPGQAPRVVEDQITYPITSKMLAVPFAKVVRGYSFFGFSFVYVIFEDGTDLYWARSRVLETLSTLTAQLPAGVAPQLGPDATGVGWAFMYTLNSPTRSLAELRSLQDWYLKYGLTAVEGVSEVASIGGFVRQYQVEVDPVKLRAYGITLAQVREAIQRSNNDVGGRVVEMSEREYMVRGLGYVKDVRDLEQVVLAVGPGGTPVLLKAVAHVAIGPEMRRGIAEWNGEGETVAGIVVVRAGADTLSTLAAVKERLAELKAGLPADVEISVAYDRTALIQRAIKTLTRTLIEESIIVALVCVVFLFHFRSAFVAIFSIPVSILLAFIVMRLQGLGANIMSLGGIAISIGVLVDAAIVMVENAHKHYEEWRGKRSHFEIILRSAQEVGPTLFFTLLVITVSFMPVFTLQAQEGRLFKPLAFTKTYAMAASAVVAVTLIPVLMFWFVRGRIHSEERHPVSRLLRALYSPVLRLTLRFRWGVVVLAGLLIASLAIPLARIGSEFMPPLWEGDLLYMPTTLPGLSATKAKEILQQTDKIIRTFPEVESVFGKIGRAETATDPAPMSMVETTIVLKDPSEWRPGMTKDRLIEEMDRAVKFPGLTNAWTMPIKTRIDMLSTGIKTPVGIKIAGPDLDVLERLGKEVEAVVKPLPGTLSAYAERVMGGSYLDFTIDRGAAARYGLTVGDVQDVIQSAIGGMNVSYTVEGLERYPINVRYPRELRDDVGRLKEILVATPAGLQVPLGQLSELAIHQGPPEIKSENARPNAWVFVDLRGIDVGTWVDRARREVAAQVEVPAGYTIFWSGQFEYMERAKKRLLVIVPLTLFLILLILYLNTKSLVKTAIVLLAVPFSLVGAIWLMAILGYNWSIAVWVGLIALAGLDAETGVVMLLYLDLAYERWKRAGAMADYGDLAAAVYHGAVQRIRPKMMTVTTTFIALVPILWATGTGADVMRRIAAPMVGGIFTSFAGELVVYPAIYFLWRSLKLRRTPLFVRGAGEVEPQPPERSES